MPSQSPFQLLRDRLGFSGMVVAAATIALCVIGTLVCLSVDSTEDHATGYAAKQFVKFLIAIPICATIFFVNPRWIRANAGIVFVISILLLIAVLFVGPVINGARRWIGFGSLRFQPSDIAKLSLCLVLAGLLAGRERATNGWRVLLAIICTLVPMALIIKEPDLGTALNFVPILLAALLASGARRSHIILLILAGLAGLGALGFIGLHGYQKERIETWWRQGDLTRAEKLLQGYHLHRSKIAIGSGGLLGYGFGEGPQNRNDLLPERHTDFAFAVICEEGGFAGASIVIFLEMLIPAGLFIMSLRVRDAFARTSIVCIGTQVGAQAIVNMGVATGAFPTTGIALPLVSYGGTSAIITLVGISTAVQLATRAAPVLAGEAFDPSEEATSFDRPRR